MNLKKNIEDLKQSIQTINDTKVEWGEMKSETKRIYKA